MPHFLSDAGIHPPSVIARSRAAITVVPVWIVTSKVNASGDWLRVEKLCATLAGWRSAQRDFFRMQIRPDRVCASVLLLW
jgi:hypothetical protein